MVERGGHRWGMAFDRSWVWLPYGVAGIVVVVLAAVLVLRHRLPPALAERLLLRGAVLLVLTGCLLLLTDAVGEGDGLAGWDEPIAHWFVDRRSAALTVVAKVWTTVGSTVAMTVLATAAVIVLFVRRHRWDALLVAVVGIGAAVLVRVGKIVIGRTRPPVDLRLVVETNQSFPSGHALASTAVLGVLAVVVRRRLRARGRNRRWWQWVPVAVVFWLGIGISRVYLGVHWATDVLGGWLTGAGWVLTAVTLVDLLDRSRRIPWLRDRAERSVVPG